MKNSRREQGHTAIDFRADSSGEFDSSQLSQDAVHQSQTQSCKRIAIELGVGQPYAVHKNFVSLDSAILLRQESLSTQERHYVILIDAIAADAESSDKIAVLIERSAAGKEYDSILF